MAGSRANTKEHLLHTAGELFALQGFEPVSTRMIAEAAEVKLSAIHYHYGRKEKLYIAALTYAVEYDSCSDFSSVIAENPALFETREGRAEIIRTTIYRSFYDHFKGDSPAWTTQLVVRELMKPSSLFALFADTVVKPDVEAAERIYLASKPSASNTEISAWIDILHSQIFLYIMAKDALEVMRGEGSMDSDFYQGVARVVARAMILELELPLPRDLQ
ncbi:MAG: AcrR family transcriptional regulator [Desulforhopalus sp.]|jgi:AcrR family transcriptional regulator